MRRWSRGGTPPTSSNQRPCRRTPRTGGRAGADVEPNHGVNLPRRHPPAAVGVCVWVGAIVPWDRVVVIEHELPHHFDLAADVLLEAGVGPGRLVLSSVMRRELDQHAGLLQ